MSNDLLERIRKELSQPVPAQVSAFAQSLGQEAGARAVLFYGSNLRTGSLEGVLDYYVLLPGLAERGIWPRVNYREWTDDGVDLRAKIATMTLAKFAEAAGGGLLDTTIWARFVQPAALVWQADEEAESAVVEAISLAVQTAAGLAAALGPKSGQEGDYWRALFEATYKAELRIEKASRAESILELNRDHFDGLLPLALQSAGLELEQDEDIIAPRLDLEARARATHWWERRKRLGKAINLVRLLRAAFTFDGAARYAAWKIKRHSGIEVKLTPWRERHPILAAPSVLWALWREIRKRG